MPAARHELIEQVPEVYAVLYAARAKEDQLWE